MSRASLIALLGTLFVPIAAFADHQPKAVEERKTRTPPLETWIPGPPPPDAFEGERVCANHGAGGEWSVFVKEEGVKVRARTYDGRKGVLPDIAVPNELEDTKKSFNIVVPVANGYLAGIDRGEWGGALLWVSRKGDRFYEVYDDNVFAVLKFQDDIIAITGLAHLGRDDGHLASSVGMKVGKDGACTVPPRSGPRQKRS